MTDDRAQLELEKSDNLFGEASDEALEAAACSGPLYARSFTVTMCTAQLECPF